MPIPPVKGPKGAHHPEIPEEPAKKSDPLFTRNPIQAPTGKSKSLANRVSISGSLTTTSMVGANKILGKGPQDVMELSEEKPQAPILNDVGMKKIKNLSSTAAKKINIDENIMLQIALNPAKKVMLQDISVFLIPNANIFVINARDIEKMAAIKAQLVAAHGMQDATLTMHMIDDPAWQDFNDFVEETEKIKLDPVLTMPAAEKTEVAEKTTAQKTSTSKHYREPTHQTMEKRAETHAPSSELRKQQKKMQEKHAVADARREMHAQEKKERQKAKEKAWIEKDREKFDLRKEDIKKEEIDKNG